MKNKISVIMPCFNSEKTIFRAISSVLSQSHSNLELIICDDSSIDQQKI
ncbi:glycosyltransferase family 2 protein [Providencia huaxiensis]